MSLTEQKALRLIAPALFAALLLAPHPTQAHPHAWIDMQAEVKFDEAGKMRALGISWEFDEFYSAFATEGLKREKGNFALKDLSALATENLTNLKDWDYFTEIEQGGQKLALGEPHDAVMTYDAKTGRLKLRFILPLAKPANPAAGAPVSFRIYDPTYYISIEYVKDKSVTLEQNSSQVCKVETSKPDGMSIWAKLPESAFSGPGAAGIGKNFAATSVIECA